MDASGITQRHGAVVTLISDENAQMRMTNRIRSHRSTTWFGAEQRYHTPKKMCHQLNQSRIRNENKYLALKANILQVGFRTDFASTKRNGPGNDRTNKSMGNLAGDVSSLRAFKLYYRHFTSGWGKKDWSLLKLKELT